MKNLIASFCYSVLVFTSCNSGVTSETKGTDTSTSVVANGSQESKENRNKETALESVRAVTNKNADEALKNATADAVDYFDGSVPATKGLDSVKAGLKMWLSSIDNYKGDNLEAVADGNKVMVYGDWSGTFKTDFMGMKTAGKSFKVKDVDIFTFNDDGKITEHRSVQSMAGMVATMGQGSK